MKPLPGYVKAKGFSNWKDYMAWIRSKKAKGRSHADHITRSVKAKGFRDYFIPYGFDPRENPRRRKDKIKHISMAPIERAAKELGMRKIVHYPPKSRFRHEKLPHRGKLHHIRTIRVGEHRVIIGCPVPVHRGRCPVATIASSILHPQRERVRSWRGHTRKNPIAVYNPRFKRTKLPMNNVEIRYRRNNGQYGGQFFKHKFRNSVHIYGLYDGSIMISPVDPERKLWGTVSE